MKEYQQRVVDEKKELDERATKLSDFIGNSPLFDDIDGAEQERMKEQCEIMWQYSEILGKRIAAFEMDDLFKKCVCRDDGNVSLGYEISCRLGMWAVSGPDKDQVEREARHYWIQYFQDGEYAELLSTNNGTDSTPTEAERPELGDESNPVEFEAQEYRCATLYLDSYGVPKTDGEEALSLVGRIKYHAANTGDHTRGTTENSNTEEI